tara:strand:+ start:62555 stop:63487 length:933 start_codon:yes stop_codon:yes gene_type:complete
MPQQFAQISDPHLSSLHEVRLQDLLNKRALGYLSWRRKRQFEHRREVLEKLQEDLRAFQLDQLLVTGDLTHIGLPCEFEQARDWLQELGTPQQVAVVPGNHDASVRAEWSQTFALWQAYMSGDDANPLPVASNRSQYTSGFPSLRVRDDIAFIGLSTGCPKPPLMATGTVGAQQLSKLPTLLDETSKRGLLRVVYLHHSPLPGHEIWRKRLTDATAVRDILVNHGAELVLHGHGHRAHFSELETRAGNAAVIAVPSASALGLHGADCARYNCYETARQDDGWRVTIKPRLYDAQTERFTAGEEQQLTLSR